MKGKDKCLGRFVSSSLILYTVNVEEGDPPGRRDRAKTIIHAACTLYKPTRDTAHMSRTHARNKSMASESERLKRMQVLWRSRLPPSLFSPHTCAGERRGRYCKGGDGVLKARRRSRINDFQRKKNRLPSSPLQKVAITSELSWRPPSGQDCTAKEKKREGNTCLAAAAAFFALFIKG